MSSSRPLLLLALAALVALVVAVVNVAAWLIVRRRRRAAAAPAAERVCGKCGYRVAGLPSFTCPECGSDLRDVGIVSAPRARRPSPAAGPAAGAAGRMSPALVGLLAAWTAIYGALYLFLGARSYPREPWDLASRPLEYGLLDAYVWPYRGQSTHAVTLTPRSDAYRRATITERREAEFRGWRNAPRVRWTGDLPPRDLKTFTITVRLDGLDGRSGVLNIDGASGSWSYADPAPDAGGRTISGKAPLSADDLYAFMLRHGVDMPSPAIREKECAAIAELLQLTTTVGRADDSPYATGRLERLAVMQANATYGGPREYPFSGTRGTATESYGPAWSIHWLAIPFGLGLYGYGTSWIYSRFRRRAGGAAPAAAAAAAPGAAPLLASRIAPANAFASPSAAPRRSRTLTILFTDLKDYTARAAAGSRDELLDLLRAHRELVESATRARGGSFVKTVGDACIATFESATEAVLAGLDIQAAAARHNAAAPPHRRLELRVACATGEVTLAPDGDVFGPPVNLASRVQSVARPGDVCFTESTFLAIHAGEVPHEEAGTHEFKGLASPVRLFRATPVG